MAYVYFSPADQTMSLKYTSNTRQM